MLLAPPSPQVWGELIKLCFALVDEKSDLTLNVENRRKAIALRFHREIHGQAVKLKVRRSRGI